MLCQQVLVAGAHPTRTSAAAVPYWQVALAATTTRVAVHQPCMAHSLHGLSWATLIQINPTKFPPSAPPRAAAWRRTPRGRISAKCIFAYWHHISQFFGLLQFLGHQKIFNKTCMCAVKVALNFLLIRKKCDSHFFGPALIYRNCFPGLRARWDRTVNPATK